MRKSISIVIFCFFIFFLSGCGGGGNSSQVVEAPPSSPTGVKVVISASNELAISWNSTANTTSYTIYWSTSPGVSKSSAKISAINATNYLHKGLATGITYYYVVTAVNSHGESSVSAEVFVLLDIPRPPGAIAAVAGDGKVTVSWSTDGTATSYKVYMASQSGVTKANYASLPDGGVSVNATGAYTQTGLVNGQAYYFVVTSINSFGESSESSEVTAVPAASGGLTVSGTVQYEDKEYGLAGFTGNTSYKAVRFAEVEAVDAASGTSLAGGVTDSSGFYTLMLPAPATIYIRVLSSASSPISASTPMVEVKDFSNVLYAVTGSNFTVTGAAMGNISIPGANWASGAFNALDVFTSGAQFVQSLSGGYPPALSAYWQMGNSNGTYFCNGSPDPYCQYGTGIYILNYNGDTDESDDDVLWHEYGHFIAANYSRDDSPGGYHYIDSSDLDLRLTWSEGWGDFFPVAVKTWLKDNSPSLLSTVPTMATSIYVDTWGGGASYFDFGNPVGTPYLYASSEAAVAKVLIGLRNSIGMGDIWDIFTSGNLKNSTEQISLEVFWDAWNAFPKADITSTLAERSILYSADSYEVMNDNSKNPSRAATIGGAAENHTLYGSGDYDYIAFNANVAQQYTVRTTALKNGADTVIRIIAPNLSTVAGNDNTNGANYSVYPFVPNNCDIYDECHENGNDILGSTASFTATANGTYYVEVKSSPSKPLSAGRYGGYSLTITTP